MREEASPHVDALEFEKGREAGLHLCELVEHCQAFNFPALSLPKRKCGKLRVGAPGSFE